MLLLALSSISTAILIGIFSILGEPVTEAPFGLQQPLSFFIETLNYLATTMPWLEVPLQIILWAIGVRVLIYIFELGLTIFKLIRG